MNTINHGAWDGLAEAHPDIRVRNPEQTDFVSLQVLITLCPLYELGDLTTSRLMPANEASIAESRVGGKWDALQQILGSMALHAAQYRTPLTVTAVFANRGVLLGGYDDGKAAYDNNMSSLERHENLYQEAFAGLCAAHGISGVFLSYDDLDIKLPQFVDPRAPIPGAVIEEGYSITDKTAKVIESLNAACAESGIPTKLDAGNKAAKKIVRQLVSAFGSETAYWLTLGYLAFDYRMPELVGPDGAVVYVERFDPLLSIGSLTPDVSGMTRVEMLA